VTVETQYITAKRFNLILNADQRQHNIKKRWEQYSSGMYD